MSRSEARVGKLVEKRVVLRHALFLGTARDCVWGGTLHFYPSRRSRPVGYKVGLWAPGGSTLVSKGTCEPRVSQSAPDGIIKFLAKGPLLGAPRPQGWDRSSNRSAALLFLVLARPVL